MEKLKKKLPIKMSSLECFFKDSRNFFPLILGFSILLIIGSNCLFQENYIRIFYSYAQQIEKNPGFQDSYWTDKTVAAGNDSDKLEEKEVGPGEGIATLAVVLVNKALSDISAIKGYLSLPDEFDAVEGESSNNNNNSARNSNLSNIAVASYDSIVKPGQEFTLYFDIYIDNDAKVGTHYSTLDLVYSKVLTAGDNTVNNIPVPFRIPGKAILDVETKNQYLSPAKINNIDVNIINIGSADANNAIITISNNADNMEGGLAAVSESASREVTDQGNLSVSSTSNTTISSSTSNNQLNGDNNVTSSSITTFGTQKYDVGNIGPGEAVSITPLIYPSITAAGTIQNLNTEISYGNSIGNRETINYNLGLVINAEPKESNFNVDLRDDKIDSNIDSGQGEQEMINPTSYYSMITAGAIEDLVFVIKKTNTQSDIKDVVISIQPSSESVKILGPSRWSFDSMDNHMLLNTTVFASEELIAKPIQLNFNVDYLLNGLAKSETLDLGLYVDGEIAIRAYDFEINVIGDEPNLVSNLLNEGNTDAFFTTVEMIPSLASAPNLTLMSDSGSDNDTIESSNSLVEENPPLQYVGDLAENSPLPVNIPLKIPNDTNPGNYPIFIKISYKDNLRNDHQLIVNGTVNYSPQIENSSNDTGLILGFINPIVLIVLFLVIIIIVFLIFRSFRKKKKNKEVGSSMDDTETYTDLDSVLNDNN
jgi:cbb3-type cytochrome oxidase subunit 3